MRKLSTFLGLIIPFFINAQNTTPVLYDVKLYRGITGVSRLDDGSFAVGCNFDLSTSGSSDTRPGIILFDKAGSMKNTVYAWDLANIYDYYTMEHSTSLGNYVFCSGTLNQSQADFDPPYIAKFSEYGAYFMRELSLTGANVTINGLVPGNGKLLVYGKYDDGSEVGYFMELDADGSILSSQAVNYTNITGACYGADGSIYLTVESGSAQLTVVKVNDDFTTAWAVTYPFAGTYPYSISTEHSSVLLKETPGGQLALAAEITGGTSVFERNILVGCFDEKTGGFNWLKVIGDNSGDSGDDLLQSLEVSNLGITIGELSSNYGFGQFDNVLVTLSEEGLVLTSRAFGGDKSEDQSYIIPGDAGSFVAGVTNSFDVARATFFTYFNAVSPLSPFVMTVDPYIKSIKNTSTTASFQLTAISGFSFSDFDVDNDGVLISSFPSYIPSKSLFSNTLSTSSPVKKVCQLTQPSAVYTNTSTVANGMTNNHFTRYDLSGKIIANKTYTKNAEYGDANDNYITRETYSHIVFWRQRGTQSFLVFSDKTFTPVKTLSINTGSYSNYSWLGIKTIEGKGDYSDEVLIGGISDTYPVHLFQSDIYMGGTYNSISGVSLDATSSSAFINSIHKTSSDVMYVKYSSNLYYLIDHIGTTVERAVQISTNKTWANEKIIRSRDDGYFLCQNISGGIEIVKISTSLAATSVKTVISGYSMIEIKHSNDGFIYVVATNNSTKAITVIKLDKTLAIAWGKEYLSGFYATNSTVEVAFDTEHLDGFALSAIGERNAQNYITTIVADNDGNSQSTCQTKDVTKTLATVALNSTLTISTISPTLGQWVPTIQDASIVSVTDINYGYTSIPMDLSASVTTSNVSCNGMSDGGAELVVMQGANPITSVWNQASTGKTFSGLTLANVTADTYKVDYTDALGCTLSSNFTITQPTVLSATTSSTNASCHGAATGIAGVSATGGTAPYSYSWSNGARTATVSNLNAGTYNLNVYDNNGCAAATQSVTITEPAALAASVTSVTNAACIDGATGSIEVAASGNSGSYAYAWSSGQTTDVISGLNAGNYLVTVSDVLCHDSIVLQQIVSQPSSLSFATKAIMPSCYGLADGKIVLLPSGGTAPYMFKYVLQGNTDTVSTYTDTIYGLSRGSYEITMLDNCSIKSTPRTIVVDEPALLQITRVDTTRASCWGRADGQASVVVAGGTSPYAYTWSTGQITPVVQGLFAYDHHIVNVSDAKGCKATQEFQIKEPAKVSASISAVNSDCYGLAKGSVSVLATAGKEPYSYAWNNGNETSSLSDVFAGLYTVTVTDACLNTVVLSADVYQRDSLFTSFYQENVLCNAGNTGKVGVIAKGGKQPISYSWTNGIETYSTASVNGLKAGTYMATVTDGCGQVATATLDVAEPAVLTAAISSHDVLCNNQPQGSSKVDAQGGVPPYSFYWSNGLRGDSVSNLFPGNYLVQVIDSNGCSLFKTASIANKTALAASISSGTLSCHGEKGTVSTSIIAGSGTYSYKWNVDSTGSRVTNVAAGTFVVTITDEICRNTIVLQSELVQPDQLVVRIDSTAVSCAGKEDGSVSVQVSGGTLPYSYEWDNGATGSRLTSLKAGTYHVKVTDNCTLEALRSVIIDSPDSLKIMDITKKDISCYGQPNGQATAVVSGGTNPYNYVWSNGQTNQTALGLFAGTHMIQVVDANGCNALNSVEISQPEKMTGTIAVVNNTCYGGNNGSALVTVKNAIDPVAYMWSVADATKPELSNLAAGSYSVTVTDGCGNMLWERATISQPDSLSIAASATEVRCNNEHNGSAMVEARGGTNNYSYSWSNNQKTNQITGLAAGTYNVTVTDGCQSKTASITLSNPGIMTAGTRFADARCYGSADGWARVEVVGGTEPYSYLWGFGSASDSVANLFPGIYTYSVHDAKGCAASGIVEIGKPQTLQMKLTAGKTLCGISDANIVSTVSGGTQPYLYKWSNNAETQNIDNIAAGTYFLTVTDNNGCTTNDSVQVNVYVKSVPLCLVTVDSTSSFNRVIWEREYKATDPTIAFYKVYCWFGKYKLLDTVLATANSVYNDHTARPRQTSYQYAISTVDKCGNESELSPFHSTMLAWSSPSTEPNKTNIQWEPYIDQSGDFVPDYYYIYKGNSESTMKLVDKVPGTSSAYIDENNDGVQYYRVGFTKPQACVVTGLKSDSGPYSQSLSNMAESELLLGNDINTRGSITLNPNPARAFARVNIPSGKEATISVIDVLGRTVATYHGTGTITIDCSPFSTGVYLVKIVSGNEVTGKSLLVE